MNKTLERFSLAGREAARARDWRHVKSCAREILNRRRNSAEGHFLMGLAEKSTGRSERAKWSFSKAIENDDGRYDAGVELAEQHMLAHGFAKAAALLQQFETQLAHSPYYLDRAGTIYANIGLTERGWQLHQRANQLQPGVDALMANLAASSVHVGRIDDARRIYHQLLERHPANQRFHYELSRLGTATNFEHVERMKSVAQQAGHAAGKNVYIQYAIAKELEDLRQWDEAFEYYRRAGDAAAQVSGYDVTADLEVIDSLIETCSAAWLAEGNDGTRGTDAARTPIFVVGLPRSGTTLVERILSCHSLVASAGESYFLQRAIQQAAGNSDHRDVSVATIRAAARGDIGRIAESYERSIAYRLDDSPMFIDKYPENFLYLGFIAKTFPHAKIVHVSRDPMDSCFALFKQSFFRYAYTLADLGHYYIAHRRLGEHWRSLLGDRMVELRYERLVSDQEKETRRLLHQLGLPFEHACLDFHENRAASNTASAVQVREKIHRRSVNRWRRFTRHLQSLHDRLDDAGLL